ncbi:hypothetical protein AK812_SmicGene28500 [Symbiodinium microadriaticum]|uniref:Uncharacterized protein n=1 Tax=Symbiodinium microadriaticum TaxID=2951 RepID=A0A1Q9D494_SYMMI|nr:hypothetical protein AK812_SmicGene28500 [Symbiodinium microadriaticum]
MEPQCARPDKRKKRNLGTERRRMIFGAYRYGGMVGLTNLTRLWSSTVKFLNAFLKKQREEQGTSAEGWNALQVSFSTGIAVHRDSQNVKGTYNFLYCSGKYKGGEDEEHPEGLPGFKVSAKDTVLKFDVIGAMLCPLEFMEFTEPTDALTVFLHVDLGKASALAELQLAEVGYDVQGQKRGPNRVMEGHLVDLTRGSAPGDCKPEFHYHLIENEELVDSILNDEVPTESYYQAYRAHLEVETLAQWGEIKNLKYLREGDAGFPLTPRGSRPYEQLADCCKAGLGGAHLQMSADLKKWLPLAYHAESCGKFDAGADLVASLPAGAARSVAMPTKVPRAVDPVSFRTCSELTADGSEIRNLSGRSMRLADGLSRLYDTTSVPQEQEKKMLERLEERTRELATAHARLKDPDCDDFLEFPEPDPSPKAASKEEVARGEALVADAVQAERPPKDRVLAPRVAVLYAPAYQAEPDLQTQCDLVEAGLRTAGVESTVVPSATSFADDDNVGYWIDARARQMSETVKRLRKQILTGVMTMIREVCRRKPRLLVGAHQGALIVLMCSLPFVVVEALRQRVSTTLLYWSWS